MKNGKIGFPSPTGVNHYELKETYKGYKNHCGFRPQQGLTIMNRCMPDQSIYIHYDSFRPQQGLTIINVINLTPFNITQYMFPSPTGVNHYEFSLCLNMMAHWIMGFRPQQGLTIMNYNSKNGAKWHG